MGKQIIKQPNGKYAIFSTVSGGFCWTDCEEEEIVEIFAEEAANDAREKTRQYLDKIKDGEKAYYQFTRTWEDAVEDHNDHFPEEPITS